MDGKIPLNQTASLVLDNQLLADLDQLIIGFQDDRIDGTDDDAYITDLIKAARQAAENYTNRAFFTQTVKQSFDGFPSICKYTPKGEFVLAKNQVQSISSITYTGKDGNDVVIDMANGLDSYSLDKEVILLFASSKSENSKASPIST